VKYAGAGQLTKMVNQILIAGIVQGLAEGLNFAVKAGLDPEQGTDVIKFGAAQSWQLENRGRTMVRGEFDFGFAVEWMRKDLGIVLDEADRNQLGLDINDIVRGGETNYISATLTLYVSLYNIFTSLLQLLGIIGGDRD